MQVQGAAIALICGTSQPTLFGNCIPPTTAFGMQSADTTIGEWGLLGCMPLGKQENASAAARTSDNYYYNVHSD